MSKKKKFHLTKRMKTSLLIGIPLLVLLMPFLTAWVSPNNFLYPVKRGSENLLTSIATVIPRGPYLTKSFFAQRRIKEASVVSQSLKGLSVEARAKKVEVIKTVLEDYIQTFRELEPHIIDRIDKAEKAPEFIVTYFKRMYLTQYVELLKLRLEVPSSAQANILKSIEMMQNIVALADDTEMTPPVSEMDIKELTTYLTSGFVTEKEFQQLISIKSNKELYESLKAHVKSGKLPASAIYAVHYDDVQELLPEEYKPFRNHIEFDELRKVVLLSKVFEPTAIQDKKINNYLSKYTVGTRLPADDTKPFIAPLIYGLTLSRDVEGTIENIDPNRLNVTRSAYYTVLKDIDLLGLNTKETFNKIIDTAGKDISRDSTLLETVQLEVLSSLKDDVVYLALPPAWTKEMVLGVRDSFEKTISYLKETEKLEQQRNEISPLLSTATTKASVSLSDKALEEIRSKLVVKLEDTRGDIVGTVYNSTSDKSELLSLKKVIIEIKTTTDELISEYEQNNTLDQNTQSEVQALKATTSESTSLLLTAVQNLESYISNQQGYYQSLSNQIDVLSENQISNQKDLSEVITSVQATPSQLLTLSNKVDQLTAIQDENEEKFNQQYIEFTSIRNDIEQQIFSTQVIYNQQIEDLNSQLKKISTENTALKSQLEQSINTTESSLAVTETKLTDSLQTLDLRFQQSLQEVGITQDLLKTSLDTLEDNVKSVNDGLALAIQREKSLELSIQAQANDIETLKISVNQLEADQKKLQKQVDNLSGDVKTIENSVRSLQTSQSELLKYVQDTFNSWSNLPRGLEFNNDLYNKYKEKLDNHYSILANQLRAEYEKYHILLEQDIQRLRTVTNQEIVKLQLKADELKRELEALKATTPTNLPGNSENSQGNNN